MTYPTLTEARAEFVRQYLLDTLDLTAWNVTKAAKVAGRNRPYFYSVCKRHGIVLARFKNSGNSEWRELKK